MNIDYIKETVENLKRNNFTIHYFENGIDAVPMIMNDLRSAKLISRSGSITIDSLGLIEKIREEKLPFRDYVALEDRRESVRAEYYLTSSNAITKDGKLVNIDGCGNRVAAMSYGPDHVFVIAGTNKIVTDVEAGLERIRKIAGPKNAKRLNKKTPCAETGLCSDCDSPDRICRVISIITRPTIGRITIYLINENLGY